jgi:hypothetical protein
MTLFAEADAVPLYRESLQRFFKGDEDPLTVGIIDNWLTSSRAVACPHAPVAGEKY